MSKPNRFILSSRLNLFVAYLMVVFVGGELFGQRDESNDLLKELMIAQGDTFEEILTDPKRYRVQVLYTQIDRDSSNLPSFKSFSFGVSPDTYFYPASTIKIFGAALSLEKINELNKNDLDLNTYVRIDRSFSGQSTVLIDSTSRTGRPSIGHYIKKLLVLSDNDAYNRTYEFLGQQALNEKLRSKGYDQLRLTHRLSIALSPEENRNTNAMEFYQDDPFQSIYRQNAKRSSMDFSVNTEIPLGKSYVLGDSIVERPMDFSKKNYCSVAELQKAIKSLIFPNSLKAEERFDLSADDLRFLRTYMSQLPRETKHPDYSAKPDNYCKFFMYGDDDSAVIPDHIRIFNKIGLAYGFCIDNAYIVDFEKNIEFLLTAVIYANENNTLNDGIYEYETVSFPFLAQLGRVIYDYELKRDRTNKPDLSEFRLTYDINPSNSKK